MPRIPLTDEAYLEYRDTPWDWKSLGLRTREIQSINAVDAGQIEELLSVYDGRCHQDGIQFTFLRINAQQRELKSLVQANGFRFTETSLRISVPHISTVLKSPGLVDRQLPLAHPLGEDYAQIEDIAESSFDFGRFHEDPSIDPALARNRYRNWIGDMRRQGCHFLVYKPGVEVVSFIAYQVEDSSAELILGGSRRGRGFASVLFWPAMFRQFSEESITRVQTVISAANTGIINLYITMNFHVDETLFGFSKQYNQ